MNINMNKNTYHYHVIVHFMIVMNNSYTIIMNKNKVRTSSKEPECIGRICEIAEGNVRHESQCLQ